MSAISHSTGCSVGVWNRAAVGIVETAVDPDYEETMARARARAAALDDAVEALADAAGGRDAAQRRRRLLDDLRADLSR